MSLVCSEVQICEYLVDRKIKQHLSKQTATTHWQTHTKTKDIFYWYEMLQFY